jgi:transposase-like protein
LLIQLATASIVSTTFLVDTWTQTSSPFLRIGLVAAILPNSRPKQLAACLQPGVSIAAIALANQLNANYLRRWVKVHRDQQTAATTAPGKMSHESAKPPPSTTLVPITLRTPEPESAANLQIEIRRPETTIHITWPVSQANACAQWLREILP